jgi:hypothetical protein
MPMIANLLGDSLKLYEIDKGLAGRNPGDPIPYLAIDTYTLTNFRLIKIPSDPMLKR